MDNIFQNCKSYMQYCYVNVPIPFQGELDGGALHGRGSNSRHFSLPFFEASILPRQGRIQDFFFLFFQVQTSEKLEVMRVTPSKNSSIFTHICSSIRSFWPICCFSFSFQFCSDTCSRGSSLTWRPTHTCIIQFQTLPIL